MHDSNQAEESSVRRRRVEASGVKWRRVEPSGGKGRQVETSRSAWSRVISLLHLSVSDVVVSTELDPVTVPVALM
jgi:hypothetical protein